MSDIIHPMNNQSIPEGSTHYHVCWDQTNFYRLVKWDHLNQVSEEWQVRSRWDFWDGKKWVPETGVNSSRFVKIA